ncbi:HET-domain-containing protein [Apiospora hydei]|uniref:HET-domain-containing protein n=1 Tax=Apiospora hydei TaxID=1337664 RepID=A0ABR1XA18_9PEZI
MFTPPSAARQHPAAGAPPGSRRPCSSRGKSGRHRPRRNDQRHFHPLYRLVLRLGRPGPRRLPRPRRVQRGHHRQPRQGLEDIRHASRTVSLWADALCINQQDTGERGHQVRIMGDIYRRAASTIIYLGPLRPNVRCLFEYIAAKNLKKLGLRSMDRSNKFAIHWGSTHVPAPSHRDSGLGLELSPSLSSDSLASIDSSSSMSEGDQSGELDTIQHAVQELCSYDWFTRGWVFQELVLSADPRIQCGRMLARWSDVAEVADEETITDRMTRADEAKINVLLEMDRATGGKGENKLTMLIRARTGSHVSDPRDFFYCLMGIANDRREWEDVVRMDYNVSVRSLYVAVAHCLIDRGEIFLEELFPYPTASKRTLSQHSSAIRSHLPSWVPDWGF